MRTLNLDQLRAFVEVVARGSFTAAAKELQLYDRTLPGYGAGGLTDFLYQTH